MVNIQTYRIKDSVKFSIEKILLTTLSRDDRKFHFYDKIISAEKIPIKPFSETLHTFSELNPNVELNVVPLSRQLFISRNDRFVFYESFLNKWILRADRNELFRK